MNTHKYQANPIRGPFNAFFFHVMDRANDRLLREHKQAVFADLPDTVVELGSGVGANLRYLRPGSRLVAVEPNPAMHRRLRTAAERRGVHLELHSVVGERIDLPDDSADVVLSSLVLCTVNDPAGVAAEVRRILRPGGRFAFVEHVAASDSRALRTIQRLVRRPWAWCFEGCSCERDLATVIRGAQFANVEIQSYQVRSPFLPINPQIAGIATA
jgi:SAM-dependent methyltransferase